MNLKQELLTALHAALATARASHAAAVEGATHAEAKAENDKDTRGLEQSYLARGHAFRVEELDGAVLAVSRMPERSAAGKVGLGSLVTVDDDGEVARYLVAPWGGGVVLADGVQVVTPQAPIGRALMAREVDDEVEVRKPGGTRTLTITALR